LDDGKCDDLSNRSVTLRAIGDLRAELTADDADHTDDIRHRIVRQ
jgi:hypothetical protein